MKCCSALALENRLSWLHHFRIVELVSGSIRIDGVDISKLGPNGVRKAISIIPQEFTLCKWNWY